MLGRAATRALERRPSPSRHSPQITARSSDRTAGMWLRPCSQRPCNRKCARQVIEQHVIKRVGGDGELQGMTEWLRLENDAFEREGEGLGDRKARNAISVID